MRQDTRKSILRAASCLVEKQGASRLTLEEVAAQAKISKGGLLYHFPTKQRLITGLVEDLIERFDLACEKQRAGELAPGSFTRAYLHATLLDNVCSAAGIVSAIANEPMLLKPLHAAYVRWQARLEGDGIDPVTATMVRLVADGLWFGFLVGAPPLHPALQKRLVERLAQLTDAEKAQSIVHSPPRNNRAAATKRP